MDKREWFDKQAVMERDWDEVRFCEGDYPTPKNESPFPPTEIPDEPEYLRELDEIRAKELCLTTR